MEKEKSVYLNYVSSSSSSGDTGEAGKIIIKWREGKGNNRTRTAISQIHITCNLGHELWYERYSPSIWKNIFYFVFSLSREWNSTYFDKNMNNQYMYTIVHDFCWIVYFVGGTYLWLVMVFAKGSSSSLVGAYKEKRRKKRH